MEEKNARFEHFSIRVQPEKWTTATLKLCSDMALKDTHKRKTLPLGKISESTTGNILCGET